LILKAIPTLFSEINERLAVASAYDTLPHGWRRLDVRGLIDGPGNSQTLIDKYVTDGLRMLGERLAKLTVVCDYGQSRSNYIAAVIYSRLENVSLAESFAVIHAAHPDSRIHPGLLRSEQSPNLPAGMTRVAVTGGHGFLGTRLCKEMTEAGFECLPLSRSMSEDYLQSSHRFAKILGDFRPDLIVHLAHPKPYNAEVTSQVAFSQLVSVVNYCEDHQVRLLYPSSWVVFNGDMANQVTRMTPAIANTRYGRLKIACESYLTGSAASGLDFRILRIPAVFGVDSLDPRFLRYFAECVANESTIIYHQFENGSARVPLIDVESCVKSIANAINRFNDLHSISHIASKEPTPTIAEIAQRLSDETGVEVTGTGVARKVFVGNFVPDIVTDNKLSISTLVHQFVLQRSRVRCVSGS